MKVIFIIRFLLGLLIYSIP